MNGMKHAGLPAKRRTQSPFGTVTPGKRRAPRHMSRSHECERCTHECVRHVLVLTGVSGNKHVDVIGNKTFPIEG